MNQTSEQTPSGGPRAISGAAPQSQTDAQYFPSLMSALWRGKLLILVVTLLAVLLGGYYAFFRAVPKYSASAVVMLNSREEQVVDRKAWWGACRPKIRC